MKVFKFIFYPIYLLTTLAVLWIAFDMSNAMNISQELGLWKYPSELINLGRILLWVVGTLLLIGLIVENIHLKAGSKKLKAAEIEIKDLHDRLYEKAQEELTKSGFTELEVDERD